MTWERLPSGGQWILGFHSAERLSDQQLACELMDVAGISFVIDGPASKRSDLESAQIDFIDGHFVVRRA
jgi:hypothetical protein